MNPDAWLTGRRGQGLAVAIGVLLTALVWFGVVDPARSWYEDRELLLEQRQGLLRHMQDLAASLPSLRAASAAKPGRGEGLERSCCRARLMRSLLLTCKSVFSKWPLRRGPA